MSFLSRILNNNASQKWLSLHPNATVQKDTPTLEGRAITYHDARSGEWATYRTDELGNVLQVVVLP